MRILFLQSLTYPFIGVMSLSAVLQRQGHETNLRIIELRRPSRGSLETIAAFEPHIVAFPVYTGWQGNVLKFCEVVKERWGSTIVLGGPHPTHCPEIVQHPAVDFICVGEGERSFPELVKRLQAGQATDSIPGIWLSRNGSIIDNGASELPDLPELPPMDIDLYCRSSEIIRKQDNREFSINRGCPFNCTYCNEPSLKSLYGRSLLRSKTVDQAVEEMQYVRDRYPFKSASFTSDNFFLKREFAFEFLDKYKREIGLPFWCQMRVELVDAELARLLREAGCHLVSVGIESGSFRVRKEILGRSMTDETIIRACATLQEHGIRVNAYNMVGIPGETFEEALQTVRLNARIGPASSWCSFFQPYPGSKLTRELLRSGVITEELFDHLPASFFDRSALPMENAHHFANLQRLFQLWVMYPNRERLFRAMCRLRVGRLYDVFFAWAFYRYVRMAYKKSRLEAFSRVLTNALEALRAS